MLSLSRQAFYMSMIGRLYNIVFVVTNTCPDETKRAFPLKSMSVCAFMKAGVVTLSMTALQAWLNFGGD